MWKSSHSELLFIHARGGGQLRFELNMCCIFEENDVACVCPVVLCIMKSAYFGWRKWQLIIFWTYVFDTGRSSWFPAWWLTPSSKESEIWKGMLLFFPQNVVAHCIKLETVVNANFFMKWALLHTDIIVHFF